MTLLSRRLFGNALLAAPLLGASPAAVTIAAAATPTAPPPVIRRRVGRFEVSFLLDGYIDFPYAVFTGIAPEALEGAARSLHIARPTGVRSGFAAINDQPIAEAERLFRWLPGPRPAGHPGLTELGL